MQRLVFEYSPAFIILCIALGLGYAWILYRMKSPWNQTTNRILFATRTLTVALIAFLLIGPILKLTLNEVEKPAVVFLVDNSVSMREVLDSVTREKGIDLLRAQAEKLDDADYDVAFRGLNESADIRFTQSMSDLHGALRKVIADYEGKNLAGIVLLSDGIYNSGPSPLYLSTRIPVFAVGAGDTTQRLDLSVRNIAFNKIAYQGNKFPLRAEVLVKGTSQQEIHISVSHGGKVIASQSRNSQNKTLVEFDFQIDATEKGMQRIDISVNPLSNEVNRRNNQATVFVEVVEGKKKILLVAPAPHPDIKALRSAIEQNANYEFHLHIPGVAETDPSILNKENFDLVIFTQALDAEGKTAALFQKMSRSDAGMFVTLGAKSNLRQLSANGIPVIFENVGQKDEVTAMFNSEFRDFSFTEGLGGIVSRYPPVVVPFGKFTLPPDASVLLYQRIGSVITNRPLLFTYNGDNNRKAGVLMGEGFWRWRLSEFSETGKTEAFDEVISRLVQYLSTRDDKRKFRSFPLRQEFSDSEPVVFESQVYNDLFEQVYGNTIQLEIRDEKGKVTPYSYVTSPSGAHYRIGGLKEGIYRYKASTELATGPEQMSGEFLVTGQNIESQNLTADFGLLRNLASATGGSFYTAGQTSTLAENIQSKGAQGLIHSQDTFHPMINLKAVFFLLVALLSLEWFSRKYLGAY